MSVELLTGESYLILLHCIQPHGDATVRAFQTKCILYDQLTPLKTTNKQKLQKTNKQTTKTTTKKNPTKTKTNKQTKIRSESINNKSQHQSNLNAKSY